MPGGIPSWRAGPARFRVPAGRRAGVGGRRSKGKFLWPQLVHHQRSPNDRCKGACGGSPTATNSPCSPKSRPAPPGGVSVVTRCEVRLRGGDGARARGRGCFGSLRSPSFADAVVGKLQVPTFRSPSYSPSQPRFFLLPPSLLSASLFSTAAPGPGRFPGRAHGSARPRGPVYDPLPGHPSLPPPDVAAGPRRRCPLWPGKQLAGSGKRLPRQELGATLRARR